MSIILRRSTMVIALVVALICIILLLNFTAANPTGRRYSSASPTTTGTSNSIGVSGERILANDLGIPRNEQADQRRCICNSPSNRTVAPPVTECRVCTAYAQLTSQFRRPDFMNDNFMGESKNSQGLLYTGRETDQIGDYAIAARAMNIPLWVYTRVDTRVDPEFRNMVESTGGGIVPYFTAPGYVDPVDRAARIGLGVSAVVLILMIGWEWASRREPRTVNVPNKPKRPPKGPKDPLSKMDDIMDGASKLKDNAQRQVDIEDSRGEH